MKRSKDADARPTRNTLKARARADAEAENALRTSGHNCPLCLQALPRIAGGRIARKCSACGAEAASGKRCAKCDREAIWELDARAACQACGITGSRVKVVGGDVTQALDK